MAINSIKDNATCHFCEMDLDIVAFLILFIPEYLEAITDLDFHKQCCPECKGALCFNYKDRLICFECSSSFNPNFITECTQCSETIASSSYDDTLLICNHCLLYTE